jgi:hypothetical protein
MLCYTHNKISIINTIHTDLNNVEVEKRTDRLLIKKQQDMAKALE